MTLFVQIERKGGREQKIHIPWCSPKTAAHIFCCPVTVSGVNLIDQKFSFCGFFINKMMLFGYSSNTIFTLKFLEGFISNMPGILSLQTKKIFPPENPLYSPSFKFCQKQAKKMNLPLYSPWASKYPGESVGRMLPKMREE